MKYAFYLLLLLATPALAKTDYSACNPRKGVVLNYKIDAEGKLVMKRSAPGVKSAVSGVDQDRLVQGDTVAELRRKNGRPQNLKLHMRPFGAHNPQAETSTVEFRYLGDRCYVSEMTIVFNSGEDKNKTLVTYDEELCRSILPLADRKASQETIEKKMRERQQKLGKKEIFGWRARASAEDREAGVNGTIETCRNLRADLGSFPYEKLGKKSAEKGSEGGATIEQ